QYQKIRSKTLELCKPLTIEDHNLQPDAFVSPAKWHLAHTTWFFEEMVLKPSMKGYSPFNDSYVKLYNSYYQTVGKPFNRAKRGQISRPSLDDVRDYRKYVDANMEALLAGEVSHENAYLITLGLNHEQQHQELLITDLKYSFSLNPFYPVYLEEGFGIDIEAKNGEWLSIEEGFHQIGYSGNSFCFDNELGAHKVWLPAFEIRNQLVTNAEYLEFVNSGGYQQFKHWLDDGWTWLKENNIDAPLYWEKHNGEWKHYTLGGLQDLHPNAPITHISYYEANAFAAWKGMRLPTEFEWEAAADQLNWGQRWEHTNSGYLPYPGFDISPSAVGEYNGKFMSNQMVLRGASIATPKGHSRKTYRNFFHPELRWQYNGIRLAK
ncbi:MAG: ergothioneine biosynthesis protein EgtB, partial [Bacteroidia bacterium]